MTRSIVGEVLEEAVISSFGDDQASSRGRVARAIREAAVTALQVEPDYEKTRLEMIAILTGERTPWSELPPVAPPWDRPLENNPRPETGRERRMRERREQDSNERR
jgi:hypothetical protein